MYFTKAIIKNHKGYSLIECIVTVSITVMLVTSMALTLNLWISDYKRSSSYYERLTEAYEALMCIDYYYRNNNKSSSIDGNVIKIEPYTGKARSFAMDGSTLRCYYEFQNQPLLYNIQDYIVEENKNVFKIKIQLKEGITVEKTYAKY